jgi:hypothetical protein
MERFEVNVGRQKLELSDLDTLDPHVRLTGADGSVIREGPASKVLSTEARRTAGLPDLPPGGFPAPAASLRGELRAVERALARDSGAAASGVRVGEHTWRVRNGRWCRFTDPFCFMGSDLKDVRKALGEGPEVEAINVIEPGGLGEASTRARRGQPQVDWYERRLSHVAEREEAAAAGRDLAAHLGPDVEHMGASITQRTEAGRAQARAVTPAESPTAIEFENQFRLRSTGDVFQPDGIRAISGNRFKFIDHKEVLGSWPSSHYSSAAGLQELETTMTRYARVYERLEGRGCAGWVYTTNSPELKIALDKIISNLPGKAKQAFTAELR